ncbi:hypothetical protein T484DRAFT_1918567 [Baffinella frigidus]|nr:hypothetical protein T484DRAFT_1918567 [Cryptophyta sp. CCMP2293]
MGNDTPPTHPSSPAETDGWASDSDEEWAHDWENGFFSSDQYAYPRHPSTGPVEKPLVGLVTVEMKGFQVIKWFGPTEDGGRGASYGGWWAGTIVGPKTWKESRGGSFVPDREPSLYCEVFFGEGKGLDCGLASLCLLTHKDIMFKTYP